MRSMVLLTAFYSLAHVTSAKIDHEDGKHVVKTAKHKQHTTRKHDELIDSRKSYTELFKGKRHDRIATIEYIVNTDETERIHYVEKVLENVRKTLEESREILERVGHQATAPFPYESETLINAVSKVLENVAFFSDLSLRLPCVEKLLKKSVKLRTVLIWAYTYAKESGLCDVETTKTLEIMAQQHGFIPKSENFINTYNKERAKKDLEEIAVKKQLERAIKKREDLKLTKKNLKNIARSEL